MWSTEAIQGALAQGPAKTWPPSWLIMGWSRYQKIGGVAHRGPVRPLRARRCTTLSWWRPAAVTMSPVCGYSTSVGPSTTTLVDGAFPSLATMVDLSPDDRRSLAQTYGAMRRFLADAWEDSLTCLWLRIWDVAVMRRGALRRRSTAWRVIRSG